MASKLFSILAVCLFMSGAVSSARASEGGTNTGGTDHGSEFAVTWCTSSEAILEEYLAAANHLYERNELAASISTLKAGLKKALESAGTVNSSVSLGYRALTRGLALTEALEATDSTPEDIIQFLNSYYKFSEYVLGSVDHEFYIPHSYKCEKCRIDLSAFERRFTEYAHEEIQWFLGTFTRQSPRTSGEFLPYGSPRRFLVLAEFVSLHVSQDLEGSLWSEGFQCAIHRLKRLNALLAAYNSGDRSYWENNRNAVAETASALAAVQASVNSKCSGQ